MWVARDNFGDLWLFSFNKPYRDNNECDYWVQDSPDELKDCYGRFTPGSLLPKTLFPGLKCEDEPLEVLLTIEDKAERWKAFGYEW